MKLNSETYEYIKCEVADIYVRYGIKNIPVCGFELAHKMGIILVPYVCLSEKKLNAALRSSEDGFYCEPGDGKEYIYYDDTVINTRCNMTILHEIGHAVLGHTDETEKCVAEAEAAFFAKYLAAPLPLINLINPSCAEDIANTFQISKEASNYAWKYFTKWKKHHNKIGKYTEYELQIIRSCTIN